MSQKLSPCPFCGNAPSEMFSGGVLYARCRPCGVDNYMHIAAWNTRRPTPEQSGQNGTRAAICAKCGERVQTSASPAALTAKQRYDECMREDEEPSAVERLRFFCSLAMNGQDWLDVEPFFDALTASPAALTEDQIAVRAGIPFVGLSVTLMKALRRLSFAAQTSGGVAGRDDELMGAIKQAQEALEAAKGKGLEEVAVDPASASSEAASPADQVGDARYWGKYETFGGETRMLWIGPMTRDEMLAYDDEYRHNSRAAMSASKEGV